MVGYKAKLKNGEVVNLEKECDCIIHDEPHWIHADRIWKQSNRGSLNLGRLSNSYHTLRGFAIEELMRLKQKEYEMRCKKIVEIIPPKEIMIQDEKIKAYENLVIHLVKQVRQNPKLRYEIGFGSKSFELLTEAGAMAFNEPVEKIVDYCLQTPITATKVV